MLWMAMLWYVDSKISGDVNDGRTSRSAFKSLQHARQVARPGDTIVIAPGIYDQDLAKRIDAARAAGLSVTVAGSET
jgi:hypothetical protein